MLYELEVLEARRIADLALDARKTRDLLLEKIPEADLGEPLTTRGEHNPSAGLVLNGALDREPSVVALREAIAALPRDIRDKLWVLTRIGRGELAILDWEDAMAAASATAGNDIEADLLGEPDLHNCLHKGLYALGVTA
jgi:hypothetical protein